MIEELDEDCMDEDAELEDDDAEEREEEVDEGNLEGESKPKQPAG